MRGQLIAEADIKELKPLIEPQPRAQVPFRVAGTDRTVWPGGGCHTSVWPIGRLAFTVARALLPALLIPLVHWIPSTLPTC